MPKVTNFDLLNHWTIIGFLIAALVVYWKFFSTDRTTRTSGTTDKSGTIGTTGKKESFETIDLKSHATSNVGQCSSEKGCSENKNLLPIMNPLFNMREICKQCILLEDHLFQTRKRCEDCCKKHFLTIEGLAEEAITLDKENKYNLEQLGLPDKIRDLEKCYINGDDPNSIAQKIRQLRKPFMNKYFDQFE